MNDRQARLDIADRVLDMAPDGAEVEVTVSGGVYALTRFANSFIHQNVAEEGDTVSIRMALDGRVSSGATNHTDADSLRALMDRVADAARHRPVDPDWPGLTPPTDVVDPKHVDEATIAATPGERAAAVKAFVDAGPGMRAAGYCSTSGGDVVFANSAGHRAVGRSSQAVIDGIHQTDASAGSGHAASVRFSDVDGAAVGAVAAQRARDSQDAYDIKPGEYEVVLAPECVATIAVFLGYYGFNAKNYIEGQSFVELGEAQFDTGFELFDDVHDPAAMGIGFDHEGTPKRRVELVAGGVTRSLVHDRRTAAKMGVESTGHAIPGSDVFGPFPSNMFVGGGAESVEELIASVERGLYVATFNYCRVLDPKSMVVTGLTRNGTFMIENGQITGAVTNLRFTQGFVEALGQGRVLGKGNDNRFADSEFGAGIVHAPSLRLAGWHFTGGASG